MTTTARIAPCIHCGKTFLTDCRAARLAQNLRAVLDAYRGHHARYHPDCRIDGPAPIPSLSPVDPPPDPRLGGETR